MSLFVYMYKLTAGGKLKVEFPRFDWLNLTPCAGETPTDDRIHVFFYVKIIPKRILIDLEIYI